MFPHLAVISRQRNEDIKVLVSKKAVFSNFEGPNTYF